VRLSKWRIDKGLTQRQLADELGCTQTAISLIERGTDQPDSIIPRRDLMLKIFRFTKGEVTPNDFYDLPALDQLDLPIGEPAAAPLFEGVQ
jgi:transcriptional regulator with XRE-family HTH domain